MAELEKPIELEQTQADRIMKSLKYAGMSHGEMAELLEVHRNTVGAWCTGKSKMMPVIMRTWAQVTGVPYEWLREGAWPEDEKAAPVKKAPVKKAPAKKAPAARKMPAGKTPRSAPTSAKVKQSASRSAVSR